MGRQRSAPESECCLLVQGSSSSDSWLALNGGERGGGSTSHAALSMASWAKAPLPSEGLAVLGDGLYLFGTAVGNHKEIASREPRVRERESAPGRHSQQ